jgi:hypothetical protein
VPKAAAEMSSDSHCDRGDLPQPLEKQGLVRSDASRNENRRLQASRPQYPHGESNPSLFPEEYEGPANGNARDNAFRPKNDSIPPDLAIVVSTWPDLSEADRKEILQVIRRAAME